VIANQRVDADKMLGPSRAVSRFYPEVLSGEGRKGGRGRKKGKGGEIKLMFDRGHVLHRSAAFFPYLWGCSCNWNGELQNIACHAVRGSWEGELLTVFVVEKS